MKALNTTSQQKGIALITALIITSIAISLAAAVMYRQQIHIRFSGNIAHMEQAYLYANGMEDWAGTFLKKSFKKHPAYDSLKDDWAVLLPPIPIPGGVMNGQLFDLQARINLNSLKRKPIKIQQQNNNQNNNQTNNRGTNKSPNNPNRQPNPNQRQSQAQTIDIAKITRDRITSLIRKTVDPDGDMGPAENFSDIVKDWIDKDQTNGNLTPKGAGSGFGAESPFYQSLAKPYFSADTSLVSPTELRLLKDMNKKVYKKLLDDQLITTLPIKLKTPINVNTANEAVLKAIGFDDQTVTNIIKEREIEPFKNLQAFLNYPDVQYSLSQLTGHLNKEDIDVKSSFFLLQGMVRINHARLFVNSLLQRKNGKVSVIMRDYSNPQVIK